VPHRFEFWKELPRNGTGKVLKREIKRILKEKA
jgi:acyl-coenzyme A synthetase/AMP-(fatty) acid ligase